LKNRDWLEFESYLRSEIGGIAFWLPLSKMPQIINMSDTVSIPSRDPHRLPFVALASPDYIPLGMLCEGEEDAIGVIEGGAGTWQGLDFDDEKGVTIISWMNPYSTALVGLGVYFFTLLNKYLAIVFTVDSSHLAFYTKTPAGDSTTAMDLSSYWEEKTSLKVFGATCKNGEAKLLLGDIEAPDYEEKETHAFPVWGAMAKNLVIGVSLTGNTGTFALAATLVIDHALSIQHMAEIGRLGKEVL